jgi:hypothetical protein
MVTDRQYVPVLRLKRAERRALQQLAPVIRPIVKPLSECPPSVLSKCKTESEVDLRLADLVNDLSSWAGRTMFFDMRMLKGYSVHPLARISASAAHRNLVVVPVITPRSDPGVEDHAAVNQVMARHQSGLCLRVSPEELRLSRSSEMISTLLERHSVQPHDVDLIIDRRLVSETSLTFGEISDRIPSLGSWRSLVVLGGTFPIDLTNIKVGHHHLERIGYVQWLEHRLALRSGRLPAFGDYTIQHPYFREPPTRANFSASIRYTTEGSFFVLRGESVFKKTSAGYDQWPAQARMLVDSSEYFGPSFSAGDRYIADRAADPSETGGPETWLQAAFGHHLTLTALQVAGLLDVALSRGPVGDAARPSAGPSPQGPR